MTDELPEWACKRVAELSNAKNGYRDWDVAAIREATRYCSPVAAFVKYVAATEEEPVDPLLESLIGMCGISEPDPEFVSDFRAALKKRGLEIKEIGK